MAFTVLAKASDGTTYGLPFDRSALVRRVISSPAPADADLLMDGDVAYDDFVIDGTAPIKVDLGGWQLEVILQPFAPKYDIKVEDIQRSPGISPCAVDKAALAGPAALLAVAAHPKLHPVLARRLSGCPWVGVLRTLARNPQSDDELLAQLQLLFPADVAMNPRMRGLEIG